MKHPSMVSNRHMPGGKEHRQGQDSPEGQAAGHGVPGQHQESHFGGRVEAQSEEHPDRVHLPRLVDPLGVAAEEPVHEATVVELALQLLVVELPSLHLLVDLGDPDQDDQIEDADQVEEAPGDRRPMTLVASWRPESRSDTWESRARIPKFKNTASKNTMVEWPREKK